MNTKEKLKFLLNEIENAKDKNFEGIGLVICSNELNIPMIPLKSLKKNLDELNSSDSLYRTLLELSQGHSPFHDGFHILNENFKIIKISQFIAPPIIDSISIGHYGSRYITALLTSKISGVLATGVIGKSYPPKVFVNGVEL